jgi:hypothetical protein
MLGASQLTQLLTGGLRVETAFTNLELQELELLSHGLHIDDTWTGLHTAIHIIVTARKTPIAMKLLQSLTGGSIHEQVVNNSPVSIGGLIWQSLCSLSQRLLHYKQTQSSSQSSSTFTHFHRPRAEIMP